MTHRAMLRITELEARVAGLEAALERRSRELRELQRHLCPRDLALLGRIASGLPAASPLDSLDWEESTDVRSAEVDEVLRGLWASVAPPLEPR
jgi:hypothetical protein